MDTELLAFPHDTPCTTIWRSTPTVGHRIMTNVATTVGQRLQVFQTMWLREMKRGLEVSGATGNRA